MKKVQTEKEKVRIDGKLKEVVIIRDATGKILHKILKPIMVEFYPRDVMQIIIGATLLAIPIGFTQEVWDLASQLPLNNILVFLGVSLLFMSSFVYYNFYKGQFKQHWVEFTKRVISTYLLSFLVVSLLLGLIQLTPWMTDPMLAFKRTVLVTFPASLSAAIADMVK